MPKTIQNKIYSKELGIDLSSRKDKEIFKWFLACLLFGKPVQQEVAKRAYFEMVKRGLVSPEAVLKAGWDKLVEVLDEGHYVRFDFSTADKLLDVCSELKNKYGTLSKLYESAQSQRDLIRRLEEFKGVGPVTVGIFLRDMREICLSIASLP